MNKIWSIFNAFFFRWRQLLSWRRGGYMETPAGEFQNLTDAQKSRWQKLQQKTRADFEKQLGETAALDCYRILDLIVAASEKLNWDLPQAGDVLDVGCKNFAYAAALDLAFKSKSLTGIELDGHRVYRDWHSRADYAEYYLKQLASGGREPASVEVAKPTLVLSDETDTGEATGPALNYLVGDVCEHHGQYDLITLFYPFVIAEPVLSWGLPLKFLQPEKLFAHLATLIKSNGILFMVNHGEDEFVVAQKYAAAHFKPHGHFTLQKPFCETGEVPVISVWRIV